MKLDWLDMENEKPFTAYPDIYHAVVLDDIDEFRECLFGDAWSGGPALDQSRSAFDDMTPVHLACVRGSRKVFQEMLAYSKSFDPFVLDGAGRMAIDYALAFRRDDMARALQARMYPDGFAKLRQQGPKPPVGPA
jgi:hypothetical protein